MTSIGPISLVLQVWQNSVLGEHGRAMFPLACLGAEPRQRRRVDVLRRLVWIEHDLLRQHVRLVESAIHRLLLPRFLVRLGAWHRSRIRHLVWIYRGHQNNTYKTAVDLGLQVWCKGSNVWAKARIFRAQRATE